MPTVESSKSNEVTFTPRATVEVQAPHRTIFLSAGGNVYAFDLNAWAADPTVTWNLIATVASETAITSVAPDPTTGDVYVSCLGTDKIVELAYTGGYFDDRTAAGNYTQSVWKDGMDNPGKLEFCMDGGVPTLLFISRGGGVQKAPLSNSGDVTVLSDPANTPSALRHRDGVVYYSTNVEPASDPDGLRSVNLDGTGDTHVVASDKLVGIALDPDDVYYTHATATVSKTYRRLGAGGTETWLDGVPDYPLEITIFDGHIYMAAFDDGEVVRFDTSAAAGAAAAATEETVLTLASVRGVGVLEGVRPCPVEIFGGASTPAGAPQDYHVDLGDTAGTITLDCSFGAAPPDRAQLIYEGAVVLDTGTVSDFNGTWDYPATGSTVVTVRIIPDEDPITLWDFRLSCPV